MDSIHVMVIAETELAKYDNVVLSVCRPKSSGTSGTLRRSLSVSGGSEFKLQEGMSVFCNNELGKY